MKYLTETDMGINIYFYIYIFFVLISSLELFNRFQRRLRIENDIFLFKVQMVFQIMPFISRDDKIRIRKPGHVKVKGNVFGSCHSRISHQLRDPDMVTKEALTDQ